MNRPDALLRRLDDIARSLAECETALALIGLGSVGRELDRLDEHSDLDFFVIAASGHKQRYIDDLSWLSAAHPLAYVFRNSADGHKFLFADGIYGEMAVFEPDELANAAYAPGRMVWRRDGVPEGWATPPERSRRAPTTEHLLGEALTNLYVGLGRFQRGEKLSAMRFIQGYAVDRVVDLAHQMAEATGASADVFDGPRRFERRYPALAAELPALLPGYERTPEAAAAILRLLERHFRLDPAITAAIRSLLPEESDRERLI
jgi:hypothetical protein